MGPKACPFCGESEAAIDVFNNAKGAPVMFRAWCPACMAGTRWHDTEKEAWEGWNARAGDEGKPREEEPPKNGVVHKNLFFYQGSVYVRNPKTKYCFVKSGDGYKRIKERVWREAYEGLAGEGEGRGKGE